MTLTKSKPKTLIVEVSLTIITYNRHNMFTIQDTAYDTNCEYYTCKVFIVGATVESYIGIILSLSIEQHILDTNAGKQLS